MMIEFLVLFFSVFVSVIIFLCIHSFSKIFRDQYDVQDTVTWHCLAIIIKVLDDCGLDLGFVILNLALLILTRDYTPLLLDFKLAITVSLVFVNK